MEPDPPEERDEFGFRLAWPADTAAGPIELGERRQDADPPPADAPDEAEAATPATDHAPFEPPPDRPAPAPPDRPAPAPPDRPAPAPPDRPAPAPPDRPAPAPAPAPAATPRPPAPAPSRPAAPRPPASSQPGAAAGSAIALGDGVAALAAVAARVDALSSATITFRNALAGQVTDYTQRVAQAVAEHAAGLDQAMRGQDRAVAELTTQLRQMGAQLGDVASSVDGLVHTLDAFRSEVSAALEAMGEEVRALRRRTPVRPRGSLERAELEAITSAVADALRDEGRPAPARRRPRQD